jgi:hypothetical protein
MKYMRFELFMQVKMYIAVSWLRWHIIFVTSILDEFTASIFIVEGRDCLVF